MRVVPAMLVLVPMLAVAGWRPVNTVALPVREVLVVDAGVILEVAGNALMAFKMSDAGVPLNTLVGSFIGGGYYGANCLVGLDSGGFLMPSPGCGSLTSLGGSNPWASFRVLSGQPWAVAVSSGASADAYASGPGANPGWVTHNTNLTSNIINRSLQTARIGSVDYVAVNTGNGVRISVDGGPLPLPVLPMTTLWRDAAPFPMAGAPAILGVTAAGGLALIRDYRTPSLFAPMIPAGLLPRSAGISGAIGMVTTLSGALISPIPDPSRPAEVWVVRQAPALFTQKIHCLDDRYCAAATDLGEVWYWENDTAPGVEVIVPQVDAGQTIRLVADAGDGDGDPVFVSWRIGDAGLPTVVGFQDGTAIDFTVPPGFCSPTVIDVTVMDGLPSHDRTIRVPVTVIDRGELQSSVSSATAIAGGPPVTIFGFIDGGCASASLTWSTSDGGSGTGPSFVWTPPATECNSDGGQVAITATANWPIGTPATTQASPRVIAVEPWGAPAAPVFASPGSQRSDLIVDWLSSGAEHVCSSSNDFPGTELTWTYDAGTTSVTEVDGGLRINAPRCARLPTRVSGSAVRSVVGEQFGRVSAPGTLVVDIVPDAPPLDATTEFFIGVEGDAGVLFGILKVDAGCLLERGTSANVNVFVNGAFVIDGGFPITSSAEGWSLPVPGGCSGGTYDVIAELHEDGGFSGATATGQVTLGYSPARVGLLLPDRIDVVCGSGARAPVTLAPDREACGAADLSWRVLNGPPLSSMAGNGATIDLQSEALDFSSVGQQIVFEWVADAGPGNLDIATRTIELGVQPFLEVRVKAHPPLRREEDAVSFEVTLKNTTACAVEGLSLTLPLTGGSMLPESVLINDVHVSSRSTDQGLVLDGVSVPASGITKIELSARARLLFAPTIEPVASLGVYVVSTSPQREAAATGCGCSQLDSSALLGLFLLLGVRRRKTA